MSNKNVTEAFIHFVKSLPKKLPTKPVSGTVSTWMYHKNKQYEDIVGLSEVKAAQHRVLQVRYRTYIEPSSFVKPTFFHV